jgi:sugar phosphate isomerase/epimerase
VTAPLGPGDLVLCAGTLQNVSMATRLAAARDGGFAAVSLFPSDIERARREEQLSDGDLRRMVGDHGLRVAELDPLLNWVPGLENDFFGPGVDEFVRLGVAVGARSLNVVLPLPMALPEEQLTAAFAGVCDRAAAHDLLVHLEAVPWTAVPDVTAADRIVRAAGRPNGGLMIDAWHHFRGRAGNAAIEAVDGARIFAVQLSDAPAEPEPDLMSATLRARRLPGDGAIDLPDLVRRLDRAGSRAPLGVEVFSDDLANHSAEAIGRHAAQSVRTVLKKAR